MKHDKSTAVLQASGANVPELEPLERDPALASVAAELLWLGQRHATASAFLQAALEPLLATTGGEYVAVANFVAGHWSLLGEHGRPSPLPWERLAEVLDREQATNAGGWVAAPLRPRLSGEVLAVRVSASAPRALSAVSALAPIVGRVLESVRERERIARRTSRLEAILEIAGQWYQTHEMEPLLVEMARAATRLLGADRASIFLWDRPNRMLVGRPALGVGQKELRIPDDAGLVGQVLQTGQPRRIDAERDQALINRRVDTDLGYQTRTLLGVPLRGKNGDLFGVFEVINKLQGNFSDEDETALIELAAHAAVALENTQERERLLESRRLVTEQAAQGVQLIGQSPAIEALRSTVRRVADTELAVLILGENGTGKEVVSQSIHYLSARRDHPFIAVNCAALTETLLESELFGHEKGAFTDAHESRPGKFELASGGTLFLDEIGDLSPGGQAKLLRVLEEKVVVRVGGSKSIHTDTRVIAATNQDLAEMVRTKKFRQDLYFRLNVVTLSLPPLRERPGDVLLLADHFLQTFCRQARRKLPQMSEAAQRRLEGHSWPGNVRELRNLMERLAYLVSGDTIQPDDLAFILAPGSESSTSMEPNLALSEATDRFQTQYIQQAIRRAGGNMSQAAENLGLHRSNLYRKMRQLGMNVAE